MKNHSNSKELNNHKRRNLQGKAKNEQQTYLKKLTSNFKLTIQCQLWEI